MEYDEIEVPEKDYAFPLPPVQNGATKRKNWTADSIDEERELLFREGSEFKTTERDEIVGIDNVLEEIDQLIHWLKHSSQYRRYDSRLEPGVIFEGDPGTGKTLVSRYIATASDALFINVRDWPHLGTLFTDTDIMALFRLARRTFAKNKKPIVLFWDEFENGAIERGQAQPAQVQVVSQLTAELDGIHGKNEGVLLIGCTNYIHNIDEALRRAGRMGLQIDFHAPDREGKRVLLNHYLSKYRQRGNIDVDTLSYFFDGDATAADIEEACVEAWRKSVYHKIEGGRKQVALTQDDLVDVFLKRLVGPPTTFVNLADEDRLAIAVHEVGHALMAMAYDIPLRLITVQPGKKSLGRTITATVREHIGTVDEMVSQMRIGIGSIVAEQEAELPAMLGSTGDVREVNRLAGRLVDNLYAGDSTGLFNPRTLGVSRNGRSYVQPNISASAIEQSDLDVKTLLKRTYEDGKTVMVRIGKDHILAIANQVKSLRTLTGDEFYSIVLQTIGCHPKEFAPHE